MAADTASISARQTSCTSIRSIVALTILNPLIVGNACLVSKACPQNAIDVRGYADFSPLGHSVRVDRDEDKGTIAWSVKYRDGREKSFLSPITTKPWGSCTPNLKEVEGPTQEQRDSQYLFNEPKYIRFDEGGLHTLESNGLTLKQGVYY